MRLEFSVFDQSYNSGLCIVVRHGKDNELLTPSLDQPLAVDSIDEVNDLAQEISVFNAGLKDNYAGVTIFHSPKHRTCQTASVIAGFCRLKGIDVKMINNIDLREMGQGQFIIENYVNGSDYPPLLQAWLAFRKKLSQGNLLYRFGDPGVGSDGDAEFPSLLGRFVRFGENQKEFSIRLYRFLSTVLLRTSARLPIVVGHQATASRIQKLFDVLKTTAKDIAPGRLVREFERTGSRVSLEHSCGVVISMPNVSHAITILSKELDFLEQIKDPGNEII